MTQRGWSRFFTDDELMTYGELVDDWGFDRAASNFAEGLSRWVSNNVRYNSDGSFSFFYPGRETTSSPLEQELNLGDTKPLDDFLETFSIKE